MSTLNKIAENIAFKLDEQFNHTLQESIKLDILNLRSTFIRRDLERNSMDYFNFLQAICVELEVADASYCTNIVTGCEVLISKQKVPKPIRLKANGRTNFHFVGAINKSISYVFTTQHEMQFNCNLPFQDDVIYYGYRNGHIVVYNNPHLCSILLEYIPANPREIDDCRYPDTFADDLEFQLPEDMISDISDLIIRKHRNPIEDGEEVNIEADNDRA